MGVGATPNAICQEHQAKRLVAEADAGKETKGASPLVVDSEA